MEHHLNKSIQSSVGGDRLNDSPRYATGPELLLEHQYQGGAAIRAASIVTEQHSKNKVFNFAEEAYHSGGIRQKVVFPPSRQQTRAGVIAVGHGERINLHHQVVKHISRSPLARLHSAKNLVRREGAQALMAHEQERGLVTHPDVEDVSSFHPDELKSSELDTEQDWKQDLSAKKTIQRESIPTESNPKQARRTNLMESAQQSIINQTQPIGTSAQRSVNPKTSGPEKISPQKVKDLKISRLQKSPPASQSKTQIKAENWFLQSKQLSGSSQHQTTSDQSQAGTILLPNLNRRKSKMSSTMSAFLEDAGQQILDSSLNQSFTLSQTNCQEIQHNALLYGAVGQSNIRESSTDFWKSPATSQTSAPITKLQSQKQSQTKEKLEAELLMPNKDWQQTTIQKKSKPNFLLTPKEHHNELSLQNQAEEHHLSGVHHHKQQSMDNPKPFKINDKNNFKKPNNKNKKTSGAILQTEEPKQPSQCLTERTLKAAVSTSSAATQNRDKMNAQTSSGQQRSSNNRHNHYAQRPSDSIVSNQTTGGGSAGSQRSLSSQNDLNCGNISRRPHLQSNIDLSSAQQTPKGVYFSISRQLAPSNSSLPHSGEVDEYQSMWADISKSIEQTDESNYQNHRDGDGYAVEYDQDTELSGYYHLFNQSICPSNMGQMDQNSSFHGSQSQASQFGQDLDSSFYVSETNSTWAKSERNSYALKSQHSCSNQNKQGTGLANKSSIQQLQTLQTCSQQLQQHNAPRHSVGLEESKALMSSQLSPFSHCNNQTPVAQTLSPTPDEQSSPAVSASASPAQKFTNQQKRNNPNQTPSKDHQNIMMHRQNKHQQSASTIINYNNQGAMAATTAFDPVQTKPEKTESAVRHHSPFMSMEMILTGFVGRVNNEEQLGGGSSAKTPMISGGDARQQMSQSVQPTSNRNNPANQMMPQLQTVPATPFLAPVHHTLLANRFDIPSPQSASNVTNSVSAFSSQTDLKMTNHQPSFIPFSLQSNQFQPIPTMFTPYNPNFTNDISLYNHHHQPQLANITGGPYQRVGTMQTSQPPQSTETLQNLNSNPFMQLSTQQHQVPHLSQLNQQLLEIQRFYEVERVPVALPEFEAMLAQIRSIQDPNQRQLAQENTIFRMQQLLEKQQLAQRQAMLGGHPGFDHRRDYSSSSSASKISSSSHHSSVSSQQRSSNQNNLKLALAQAFHDLDSLQTPEERTSFLIQKAQLFAKDKSGFQLLKNKIDEEVFKLKPPDKQSQFLDDIFSQLLNQENSAFHKLMMHQVANFFCQELFRQASNKQLENVLEAIRHDFCKIAVDIHGTRALQVLLEDELIQNQKETERTPSLLFEALKNSRIFELSCNIRGNHVLRQCLMLLKTDERRSIIYEPVIQYFMQVARDKHGCQVVKECITTAQGQWKQDLIRVSSESIEMLINDEFGNFVIQAILDHFVTISKRKQKMDVRVSCFYEFIRLNLGKLCKQQYSSRVVEKAVETMPKEQFEKVCNVFMKHSNKKCKMYKEIMLDSYGNYIAPKILERAKGFNLHQFESFKQVYRDSIEALKKVKHGRQLMGKMNQIAQQPNKGGKVSPTRQTVPTASSLSPSSQ